MNKYIKANILRSDLVQIDKSFIENGIPDMHAILLLKQALITISNFYEFELSVRPFYKNYPDLSTIYKEFSKQCEFVKYLRNKFIGHIKEELIDKAIEWRPELRILLNKMNDEKIMYLVNLFILETAINTYVDENEKHKIFDSETDLIYPNDNERFLIFLQTVIQSSINFLNQYIAYMLPNMLPEIQNSDNLNYAIDAGKTKFSFIKK